MCSIEHCSKEYHADRATTGGAGFYSRVSGVERGAALDSGNSAPFQVRQSDGGDGTPAGAGQSRDDRTAGWAGLGPESKRAADASVRAAGLWFDPGGVAGNARAGAGG